MHRADFWCMPQGDRDQAAQIAFDHMLSHVNFLYLGCHVLVLLDLSYLSRFWVSRTAFNEDEVC